MRTAMPEDRRKIEYRLTDKGAALLPTMIALRPWGERWETGIAATPVLVDARDRRPIGPVEVRAYDGRLPPKPELISSLPEAVPDDAAEVRAPAVPGPGMGQPPTSVGRLHTSPHPPVNPHT